MDRCFGAYRAMSSAGRLAAAGRWLTAVAAVGALAACARSEVDVAYAEYAAQQIEAGRFRTDVAPSDAPWGPQDVLQNWRLVAFEPEAQLAQYYDRSSGRRLSRWRGPIAYRLIGDGVRSDDLSRIGAVTGRLSELTGLEFTRVDASDASARLSIFVFGVDARRDLARRSAAARSRTQAVFDAWASGVRLPCFAVFNASTPQGGEILSASIYVSAELDDPLRTACFTEEITQTLGLFFDHASVRPSIFNDDQEFIALTTHDEALLRLHYDPELRPGLTAEQAEPIVRRLLGLPPIDA